MGNNKPTDKSDKNGSVFNGAKNKSFRKQKIVFHIFRFRLRRGFLSLFSFVTNIILDNFYIHRIFVQAKAIRLLLNCENMKTKIERINEAIKRNREKILKGGDRIYYTKQILNLNKLASEIEK